jgi:hypothetical protein
VTRCEPCGRRCPVRVKAAKSDLRLRIAGAMKEACGKRVIASGRRAGETAAVADDLAPGLYEELVSAAIVGRLAAVEDALVERALSGRPTPRIVRGFLRHRPATANDHSIAYLHTRPQTHASPRSDGSACSADWSRASQVGDEADRWRDTADNRSSRSKRSRLTHFSECRAISKGGSVPDHRSVRPTSPRAGFKCRRDRSGEAGGPWVKAANEQPSCSSAGCGARITDGTDAGKGVGITSR